MKQLNFPVKINEIKNELWELLWSEHYFKPGLTLRLQQVQNHNFTTDNPTFISRVNFTSKNKRA